MIGYNSVDIRVFLRPLKDIEFHKSDFSINDNSKYLEFPDDISPVRTVPKKSKSKNSKNSLR